MENNYTDLRFSNDQLMKLVSSAEILFQHLYDLVSAENRVFIDQWFCYKQEYDETCSNNSQFDVNENVPECSVLPRIDEVSENEKLTSSVSSDVRTSESNLSIENSDNNKNYLIADEKKEVLKSSENLPQSEADTQMSQIDSDLLEYMTEFKLFTDGFVADWFKTLSFNTAEIREYLAWLENKEYKRVWTNIYNNVQKKNCTGDENFDQEYYFNNINNIKDDYISLETSQISKKALSQNKNQMKYNSLCRQCYNESRSETIDQQIRHLQEVRHVLMCTRENINIKMKKEEMNSSTDYKRSLKVDVAFEIIDSSIEMKNRLKLGYDVQDLCTLNDEVDTVIVDCLRTLSLYEVRHLLITYLKNVIEMRKSSSECDKQILKLDSEISNQKFLIWRLYMMINENKRSYESQCLTLHKEFEQKLKLIGKTNTDESNDSTMESIAGLPGRKLLSIIEKNDAPESSHSDLRDMKDGQNMVSLIPSIPEKSLRTLQNTSTSSGTKVTRSKKKIIIQTQKH